MYLSAAVANWLLWIFNLYAVQYDETLEQDFLVLFLGDGNEGIIDMNI